MTQMTSNLANTEASVYMLSSELPRLQATMEGKTYSYLAPSQTVTPGKALEYDIDPRDIARAKKTDELQEKKQAQKAAAKVVEINAAPKGPTMVGYTRTNRRSRGHGKYQSLSVRPVVSAAARSAVKAMPGMRPVAVPQRSRSLMNAVIPIATAAVIGGIKGGVAGAVVEAAKAAVLDRVTRPNAKAGKGGVIPIDTKRRNLAPLRMPAPKLLGPTRPQEEVDEFGYPVLKIA